MSGEQLMKITSLMGMIQMRAVNIVALSIKHSIHHRGQPGSELDPSGSRISSIYSHGADTQ